MKLIPILLTLVLLSTVGWASEAIYIVHEESRDWVVSNELIKRLDLKPGHDSYALNVYGENGRWYSWTGILEAHMDWVEAREEKDEEDSYYHCPKCWAIYRGKHNHKCG